MNLLTLSASLIVVAATASAQLSVPTADTSEWRFSGVTGDEVDKEFGPGELRAADGATGQTLMNDVFTTTSAAGIPNINGVDATPTDAHFQIVD